MKRIISILLLFAMVLPFALTSCKKDNPAPEIKDVVTLNVYNWGEYISDGSEETIDTNDVFEKYFNSVLAKKYQTKVKVNYTTYATNEDMYSKLSSGAGDGVYDVIIPSEYMIQRMADEGMLYEFDVAEKIPYYQYIRDEFKGQYWDPEQRYSVPYTYGMVGVIYNSALMDERDLDENGEIKKKSWSLLWNEGYEGDYSGKILQFNNPRDAFGTAMYYKKLNINSPDKSVWQEALSHLKRQKSILQGYVNDEIFNKMTTNSATIAAYYAGDYVTMAADNEDLKFFYPDEGTNVFVDAMCIPKSSKNKEIAIEYINFMLMNDVKVGDEVYNIARANAEYIGYASPNRLVTEDTEGEDSYLASIGEDAYNILYAQSVEDIRQSYGYDPYYHSFTEQRFDDGMQFYVNDLWEQLKTESNVELWVHISSITIVVAIVGMCSYGIYIKKKRSSFYRKRDSSKTK